MSPDPLLHHGESSLAMNVCKFRGNVHADHARVRAGGLHA